MVVVAYVVTQRTSHALRGLVERLGERGLPVIEERRTALGSFGCFVARKPDAPAAAGTAP